MKDRKRSPLAFNGPEPGFRGRFAGSAEGFRSERPSDDVKVAELVQRVQALAEGRRRAQPRSAEQLAKGIAAAREALAAGDAQAAVYLLGEPVPGYLLGEPARACADESTGPASSGLPSPYDQPR